VLELLAELEANDRRKIGLQQIVRFLRPTEIPFEAAMSHVNEHFFNNALPNRLGGTLLDVAYLADFRFGKTWAQINVGAVRAAEIPGRLGTQGPREIPPVAYFYSVTGRVREEREISGRGVTSLLDSLLELGDKLTQELES
jgi:hypothetical protein